MASLHIQRLIDERKKWEDHRDMLLGVGQEHQIPGSHSFKGIDIGQVERRIRQLNNQIAAMNNGSPVVQPDFS